MLRFVSIEPWNYRLSLSCRPHFGKIRGDKKMKIGFRLIYILLAIACFFSSSSVAATLENGGVFSENRQYSSLYEKPPFSGTSHFMIAADDVIRSQGSILLGVV